jgi:hypothetical protein
MHMPCSSSSSSSLSGAPGGCREGGGGGRRGGVPGGKGESETVCWERRFVAGGGVCYGLQVRCADSSRLFFLPSLT